jgi:hypothetical protein
MCMICTTPKPMRPPTAASEYPRVCNHVHTHVYLVSSSCSDWESLCIYDSRYGIELFNYDLLHPTSFNDYDEDDDSNG